MIKPLLIISIMCSYTLSLAQSGGRTSFEFLNLPVDTRLSALGGVNVSLSNWDINSFFRNPATLNTEMNGQVSFNHAFYYADIHLNQLAYAHTFRRTGTWGFGVQHINYGTMETYDPAGNYLGEIRSTEAALNVGNMQRAGHFRIGGNVKLVFSSIAGYRATALMIDLGGMYVHPTVDFTVGMTFRNMGFVISDYEHSSASGIPFDIQIGTSYKPEHMPVRFSLTAYKLNRTDLLEFEAGRTNADKASTFEEVFSHFNFGAEVLVSKHVNLRAGYNYLIRRQLKLDQKAGGSGFSYGIMFRIRQFELSYSRGIYHVAGGINYAGLSVNLKSLYKKKEIKE